MLYVYEFEIVRGEKYLLALPFDFDGGTQGEDEREVSEMAADWLKAELEHRLMNNISIPKAILGHLPREQGRILVVAVEASLDTIDAVSAAEAADMLGVTRGRVSQMCKSSLLDWYRKGRDVLVTLDSIHARLADTPKVGRPKKRIPA